MTDTVKRVTPAGRVWWGRLDETEEGRRLLVNPKFRKLMEEARRGEPAEVVTRVKKKSVGPMGPWAG